MDSFSSDLRNTNMYSGASSANQGGGVINAASLAKLGQQLRNNSELSILDLKPGDSFKGQISSVNGNEIELLLSNGELLEARIEGKIQLLVGQMLSFQVQSNEQNKIILKPFLQNENMVGDAALKAASLPINERTRNLVASLLENGMSVDKNNLGLMNRASLNFPEADLKTLAMLSKMNIPLTKDNVTQYENYKNFEYKLLDSMDDMLSDIDQVLNKLPEGTKADFIREVLNAFSDAEDSSITVKEEVIQPEQNLQANDNAVVENNNMVDKSIFNNDTQTIKVIDNNLTSTHTKPSEVANLESSLQGDSKNAVINENVQSKTNNQVDLNKTTDKNLATNNSEEANIKVTETIIKNQEQTKNSNGLNGSTSENLIKNEQNAKQDTLHIKNNIGLKTDDNFELLLKNLDKPEVKSHIKSRIRELVSKNWMLEPKEVEAKENIQKLYDKVSRQSRQLQDVLEQYSKNTDIEPKSAANIQKNLQFMEQLDHVFSYVQLPLKFSEGKAHGDLYVMTNKRNLAKKDGTLSAFLHLDMTYLGSTDIKLTLQTEQNRLRCDFYLQEDSLSLVANHIDELNKALEEKGYIIKTTVNPYENDKSVIEKMEHEAGLNMTQVSYQSFDIRA